MTTATRWWAPSSPGIGPDEDDLFLFQASDDPPQDLGHALLGLHRVGAAACEAVATQPLSDEWLLRGVLAKAREMVAPPALVTVGKALGDERYSGLLLRDVLDDAEAAAVSLYRTCVAKGCASSLAASRVGKVYGVPLHRLGRYTAIAQDPKANAALVDETADRALMEFVFDVVKEEEPQGAKVTFAKAPTEDYLESHNETQDARGRFTRLRASQQALPGGKTLDELLKKPAKESTVRKPGLRQSQVRGGGLKAVSLRESQIKEVEQSTRSSARRAGRSATRRATRSSDRSMSARQSAYASGHERLEAAEFSLGAEQVPDTLAERPAGEQHAPLGYDVAYALPGSKWNAFKSATGQASGNRAVFRADALATYAGGAERYGDDNDVTHQTKVSKLAEMMLAADDAAGIERYYTKTLNHRELVGTLDAKEYAAWIEREKKAFLDELGVRNSSAELQYTVAADDYDNPMLTVLVYMPPSEGRQQFDRPDRRIWEVVVDAHRAVGVDRAVGTKRGREDPELDPNLPLAVTDVSNPKDVTIDRFFHRVGPEGGGGYFRNVVHVQSADEEDIEAAQRRRGDIGKASAEEHAERSRDFQRMLLAGLIQRDPETGEFTETGVGQRKPGLRSSGLRSSGLRSSAIRQAPQASRSAARASQRGGLRHAERKPMTRKAIRQAVQIALEQEHAPSRSTYLDPGHEYAVLDSGYKGSDMDLLVNENGLHFLEQTHQMPVNIERGLHERLDSNDRVLSAKDAVFALIDEQNKAFTAQPIRGGIWTHLQSFPAPYDVTDENDLDVIALDLEDYVSKHPDIGALRAVWRTTEDGRRQVQFLANLQPMPEQYLVRYEDTLGDGPLELTSEGESRLFSADGIASWLKVRYHGTQVGGTLSEVPQWEEMMLPRVHTFVATRRPHEP